MTSPLLFPATLRTDLLFSDLELSPRAASEEYQIAIAEHNEVLKNIARTHNASLFDFASMFPRELQYFEDGVHVTEVGARLKAQMFANFMV
ncbi:MAG: hypothetical protein J7641_12990 [Cyanobacteria bacterium SID2]|nr:hypothetical protein [Cyanobacteria bacterium SID2]